MKPQTVQDLPTFNALLTGAGIKLVDIGGRGAAMPQVVPLAPVAHYFACEPDKEEAERLKVNLPEQVKWRGLTIMTEAIASHEGEAQLHLTHQPGMSSLLEPDMDVANRFCVGPKFRPVSIATVPTIRLDTAAARYGFADATFLKLDTQGTELDILKSAGTLLDSLLGVYVESLFHPIYKGQSLFSDVDVYLRQQGFSLFGLYRTMLRRASYRPEVYSRRVITWAHCLYFREPATLLDTDAATLARKVVRLLALAVSFQHYDLAFELLALAEQRQLFAADQLPLVRSEVEALAAQQTRRLLRKAGKDGGDDKSLLAGNSRDNRYVE